MRTYDLNTEQLPPYNCFGNAVIDGRVYLLAMAQLKESAFPFPCPLVICIDLSVAWHGSWESLVVNALTDIKDRFPVH